MLFTYDQTQNIVPNLSFTPTFTDNITASEPLKQLCNNSLNCIVDTILTGSNDVGQSTFNSIQIQSQNSKVLGINSCLLTLFDLILKWLFYI